MRADFHTHILPCVDDGSRSIEQSLEMLQLCKEMGLSHVVLTPHFYADRDHPDRFLARRTKALAALEEAAAGKDLPTLIPAAEVHYFPNMGDSDELKKLTIGSSRYILVEMPMCRWTDRMWHDLERIYIAQGITPILAHLDRYLTPFNARRILRQIEKLQVMVQVNGERFLERKTARMVKKMMKSYKIHLLGSDCHNMTDRKPNLGQVRNVIHAELGQDALDCIAYYEQRIFKDGKVIE